MLGNTLLLLLPVVIAAEISDLQGRSSSVLIFDSILTTIPSGATFQSPYAGQSVANVTGLVTVSVYAHFCLIELIQASGKFVNWVLVGFYYVGKFFLGRRYLCLQHKQANPCSSCSRRHCNSQRKTLRVSKQRRLSLPYRDCFPCKHHKTLLRKCNYADCTGSGRTPSTNTAI